MAEYPRDPANERGTGYTGGASGTGSTGGTGYTGGTGNYGDPERRPGAPREPKSSAAVWIVGIVVVVGALAIWIARNTVDEADTMQSRPGMEQMETERVFDRPGTENTADPVDPENGTLYENRPGDQGRYGTGTPADEDAGATMEGQQGSGTIEGRTSSDPRMNDEPATGTHGTGTIGTQGGGTGTVGGGSTGNTDQEAAGGTNSNDGTTTGGASDTGTDTDRP